MQEMVLILDFGSQYTQLIARRIRELNVYCEIHPYNKLPENLLSVKGVVLSGSPFSVRDANAPHPDLSNFKGKVPVLGVCYGAQYLSHFFGGEVAPSDTREYGRANLKFINTENSLLKGLKENTQVWMSHADTIKKLPQNAHIIASTTDVEIAGYAINNEETYCIQFHPEVYHTTEGATLLKIL